MPGNPKYPALPATTKKNYTQRKIMAAKKSKPVWEKERPKSLGAPKKLSPAQKASAKAAAKAAGRPYPNLVDNMRAAKGKKKK